MHLHVMDYPVPASVHWLTKGPCQLGVLGGEVRCMLLSLIKQSHFQSQCGC